MKRIVLPSLCLLFAAAASILAFGQPSKSMDMNKMDMQSIKPGDNVQFTVVQSGKDYVVTITKEGYGTQSIPVRSSPNGWYIAGNFVFGSIIGWFVIDPWSGNMWSLSPDVVAPSLQADAGSPAASHNNASPDRIRIMLLQDVPQDLRAKMTRINPAKS